MSSESGEAEGTKGDFNSKPKYVVVKFINLGIDNFFVITKWVGMGAGPAPLRSYFIFCPLNIDTFANEC